MDECTYRQTSSIDPQQRSVLISQPFNDRDLSILIASQQNELSKAEQAGSAPVFLSKVAKYKPKIVCLVGLGITKIVKHHILAVSTKSSRSTSFLQSRPFTSESFKAGERGTRYGVRATTFQICRQRTWCLCVSKDAFMSLITTIGSTRATETLFFAVASTSGRVVQYQVGSLCFSSQSLFIQRY
jgi:TDG/mug DNA glycosylase family protein